MRILRVAPMLLAAVAVGAAKPGEAAFFFFGMGLAAAATVVVGMPLALALHAFRREWIEEEARAVERRATACVVVGAVLFIVDLIVARVLYSNAPALAWLVVAASAAWFYAGFAGCALRHGRRMLGASADADSPRPLVLGWLARAGLFAVPVVWPFVGAYLVVAALGAPLVALSGRGKPDEPPPVT